ncbi:N-formylglutamate amidohydrolase [Acidocella sp.]|uniref:N-formylglutamate amidohydrolase n=1 Tax=Acidocella sp. TaxID=50710 RepID=UPI0026066275|nr:N-formylglutamate amidohydrolase [Acidocella sp.]
MTVPILSLRRPVQQSAGIIVTSPHSGRCYSQEFLAASRLNALELRGSEDSFVDELFDGAPEFGVPMLAAEFPRAWCDVNREQWELDQAMFSNPLPEYVNTASPRVSAGLGTIARVVGTGAPIYRRKLFFEEAKERIETCWCPFHEALRGLIEESRSIFGYCLVLDCHSMPTPVSRLGKRPDIILGDGHGTSCYSTWIDHIQTIFENLGFSVLRNDPYAGGFITRHYGRPSEGVHVVQIEIARSLYMHELQFTKKSTFETLRHSMASFMRKIVSAGQCWGALGPHFNEAAE